MLLWQGAVMATGIGIESRMEVLSDELQLTADQKSSLEAIFNDKHEKYRAIREETQSRIRALLTAEQFEQWSAIKKQSYDQRHGGFSGAE